MRQDVRNAIRRLTRQPAFAMVSVLTLALGIGANTAIFSVLKAVILQPLPYADPERVALVWDVTQEAGSMTWLSNPEVLSYQRDLASFERVSAYLQTEANLTGGPEPERIRMAFVTPELFDTLGVTPLAGRTFTGHEHKVGGNDAVVILSHALWTRRFGGDPAVVGTAIHVQGTPHTVIGVMPRSFRLPLDYRNDRSTEAFAPFAIDPANPGGWGDRSNIVVGRLRPDATVQQATAELEVLWRRWVRAGYVEDPSGGRFTRSVVAVRELVTGNVKTPLLVLLGTVGFVLLIAIANVANLSLAKADARSRDVAIQAALGAERGRLVRELLTESVLLSAFGGAVGLAIAWGSLRLMASFRPAQIPRVTDAVIDPAVLAFTAALALAAGLLFGLAPALQLSRPNLTAALLDGGRTGTAGPGRLAARRVLAIAQLALSVVLVLGAGLLTRSLMAVNRIDLGFHSENVLTAQLQLPARSYPEPQRVITFYRELLARLEETPGVVGAGAVRILPLSRTIGNWSIMIEGQPRKQGENPNGDFQYATPGYFAAMGLKLLRGRLLTESDDEDGPMVVVINEAMAKKYWPGGDALGKRFHLGTLNQPWLTVVGIVGEVRHNAIIEEPRTEMYLPHAQVNRETGGVPRAMALVVRTDREALSLVPALRGAVRAADPNLPLSDIRLMERVADDALSDRRFTTVLLASFAVLALVLASIGIYGTISLMVSERTHEIGIRLALGAQRGAILGMILRQGVTLTLTGLCLGLAGAVVLTKSLEQLLYGVTRLDVATFTLVPALLACVAMAACLNPARRAAGLSPLETLRR